MSQMPLSRKLLIKPGYRVAVSNAPEGHTERLNPLPEGATVSKNLVGEYDLILVYVSTIADADVFAPEAIAALKPKGVLWFAFPKKSSKIKTDINRDDGWDTITTEGWEAIATISIDDLWSGIRFVKR